MVNELQARLHSLYNGRTPWGAVGPQTVGFERYRLVATGAQLYTLLEAADRIATLEAALRACTEKGANIHVIARDALTAPETPAERCKHGVWAADHCDKCASDKSEDSKHG